MLGYSLNSVVYIELIKILSYLFLFVIVLRALRKLNSQLRSLKNFKAKISTNSAALKKEVTSMCGLSVLIAEDNLSTQKLTARMFEQRGCKVVVVANGKEAIDAWSNTTFDLILMDVQMPLLDGYAATATIREREQEQGGHIPIIALTAHTVENSNRRCLDAGMDAYIAKPFNPGKLIELVGSLLGSNQ